MADLAADSKIGVAGGKLSAERTDQRLEFNSSRSKTVERLAPENSSTGASASNGSMPQGFNGLSAGSNTGGLGAAQPSTYGELRAGSQQSLSQHHLGNLGNISGAASQSSIGPATSNTAGHSTGFLTAATPKMEVQALPKPEDKVEVNKYKITDIHEMQLKLQEFREKLEVAKLALKADVKYEFAIDKMDPKTKDALGKVADAIKMLDQMPEMEGQRFTINGHTDSKGDNSGFDNQALSQRRADDLKNALVKMGVNPDRLVAIGHGSSQPIAANELADGRDNPQGRALNRRSELGFSMTEVDYKAYLARMEVNIREQYTRVETETKITPGQRADVKHLEMKPGGFMASSGFWGTPEQRQAYEEAQRIEAQKAADLAKNLNRMVAEKTDLKITEYNGQSYNLALRVDKNSAGQFLVSVYSPHNGQALQTNLYANNGSFLDKNSIGNFNFNNNSIEDAIKGFYQR